MRLLDVLRLVLLGLFILASAGSAEPGPGNRSALDLKKNLFEEGRYADLLEWMKLHEPSNRYLIGVLESRLTNTASAVSNLLACTNDRDLRDYAFYNTGLALSRASSTDCLAWFDRAGQSTNPWVRYQSELQSAGFLLSVSNRRAAFARLLDGLGTVQRWERVQPSLLPFLGHAYLTKLLSSLSLTAAMLGDPRSREFAFRVLSMNAPNRWNPSTQSALTVLTNGPGRTFQENLLLFRHLSVPEIRSPRTGAALEEALRSAPSPAALIQVLELGFDWWLPNDTDRPGRGLKQYADRFKGTSLEDGILYLRMLLSWGRRDKPEALTNFRRVFSNAWRDPVYEAKALSFGLRYMSGLPLDPGPLGLLRSRQRQFATNDSLIQDIFQYALSSEYKKSDPAGTLAYLTNLPASGCRDYFIARCLERENRRTEAVGRYRSLILGAESEYFTSISLVRLTEIFRSDKGLEATNLSRATQALHRVPWKDGSLSAIGRGLLETLSFDPSFIVPSGMVDALLAGRPGLRPDLSVTNGPSFLRLKKFFDSYLVDEGSTELLLDDRNDLPFCSAMASYFGRSGYAYLQMRYAERVHSLLKTGFPAWRISHPLVGFLYPEWYKKEVLTLCDRFNLPPPLVYAVIREESRFRHDALSRSGASGLMQLMPGTFDEVMRQKSETDSAGPITSPAANIFAGTAFLKNLLKRYNDESEAVAAYNAGPTSVDRWLRRDPPVDDDDFVEFIPYAETRSYVRKVRVSRLGYERR